MSKDDYKDPQLQSGHTGDEEPRPPQPGPPVNKVALSAEGKPGQSARRNRAVGSWSGAALAPAGPGGAEDFDSDPAGGGGAMPSPEDDHPKSGADAPVGGSR
jgi:hypothetical protein